MRYRKEHEVRHFVVAVYEVKANRTSDERNVEDQIESGDVIRDIAQVIPTSVSAPGGISNDDAEYTLAPYKATRKSVYSMSIDD
jgi:hypothetical protein